MMTTDTLGTLIAARLTAGINLDDGDAVFAASLNEYDGTIETNDTAIEAVINGVFALSGTGLNIDAARLAATLSTMNPLRTICNAAAHRELLAWAGHNPETIHVMALRVASGHHTNLLTQVGAYHGQVDLSTRGDMPANAAGYSMTLVWMSKIAALEVTDIILDALGDDPATMTVFRTLWRDHPVAADIPGSVIGYATAAADICATT